MRAPRYVSPNTKSLTIREETKTVGTFNVAAKSASCKGQNGATVCQFKATVTTGKNRVFFVTAYDADGGKGHKLATAQIVQTIAGGVNIMPLALSGVAASVSAGLAMPSAVPAGTPAAIPVIVMAKDADGNVIIGQEDYSSPVTLTDSDTSGATLLSRNGGAAAGSVTVHSPADQVTLQYSGRSLTSAAITPSANGVKSVIATAFSPVPVQVGDYVLPSSNSYVIDPYDIAAGSDGNLWITLYTVNGGTYTSGLAKMTPSGSFTLYIAGTTSTNLPNNGVGAIVGAPAGSSQAAWFIGGSQVGSVAPNGSVTMYTPPGTLCGGSVSGLMDIVSDGSSGVWVSAQCTTGGDALLHVASNGAMSPSLQNPGIMYSSGLAFGKDGKLYVAGQDPNSGNEAIAQVTVSGAAVVSSAVVVSSQQHDVYYIAAAADGSLYATAQYGGYQNLLRVQPATPFSASPYANLALPHGGWNPEGIVGLPDGTLWLANYQEAEIAQIVPSGAGGAPTFHTVALTTNPSAGGVSFARVRIGPDGALYVINQSFVPGVPNGSGDIVKVAY